MAKTSKFSDKLQKLATEQKGTVKRIIVDGKPINYVSPGLTGGGLVRGESKLIQMLKEFNQIYKK